MINWEDIKIFMAVTRAGGLAGAVPTTHLSPPTLGRRILALERNLGVTLFSRHRLGYDLTTAGRELFERSGALEQGALAIERWRTIIDPHPVVKIAAGSWTSSFISSHIQEIIPAKVPVRIELVTGVGFLDISRREVNLGIRNKRPHQTGLACLKIGQVDFAIYGAPSYITSHPLASTKERYEACEWITLLSHAGNTPSLTWLEQYIPGPARLACSSSYAILDAVVTGAGLCILPCFIGDHDHRLSRVSGNIGDLTSTRWLVSHDDDRHDKPIRLIADRLAKLFLAA